MSPLKAILVSSPPRRERSLPFFGPAFRAAFVLALACCGAAAQAVQHEVGGGDVLKAEKILAKLRLLHDAADAGDAGAYQRLASKMYPDLFVKVAELRAGELSTDLSTAVFLAEKLARTWTAAGAEAADCRSERPDIYRPLCLGLRDGTVRGLMLAKSRLHARWAEAVVRSHRGESDAETARALREMETARANDVVIAARLVEVLKPLEGFRRDSSAGFEGPGGEFAEALRVAASLLDWMPRGQTFYRLAGAQQAYVDGLSWQRKVTQSKRLVVSVNSFAPDPLKVLDLDAGQASAAAAANWKSAARLTRLTERSLSQAAR
jgi:hypothetical protein